MPFTNYALDNFAAQELSQLTAPTAKPIGPDFSRADDWLADLALGSMLTLPLSKVAARYAFAWVRRAAIGVERYDEACASLAAMTASGERIRLYFRALANIESAIAAAYQAVDYARRALGRNLYERNDGSVYDRLNRIYNDGRHTDLSRLPEGHLHPVWLANEGVHSCSAFLEFAELESVLRDLCTQAELLLTQGQSA